MFHPLLNCSFLNIFRLFFGNLYHKKSNSQRYQRIKMAYKWGRSMTSCNIKELPLLPPTANTNTNTSINDWQDTSSNISLSEYRERLLRRNMIDDPNDDYSQRCYAITTNASNNYILTAVRGFNYINHTSDRPKLTMKMIT